MNLAKTVLVVDDDPKCVALLGALLRPQYDVVAATSGEQALEVLQRAAPDLVLLDIVMPGISGHDVLATMRASPALADVPVICTTALAAEDDERRAFDLGAGDYVVKPWRPAPLLARVGAQLDRKRERDALRSDRAALVDELARRIADLCKLQDATVVALSRLARTRDDETGGHLLRTQECVRELALLARTHPRFAGELDASSIDLIARAAPLHDIGKVGIPDHVLRKPAALTAAERALVQTHTRIGAETIERADTAARRPLPLLRFAKQVALHHHERWDGSGYPDGLAGAAIPLAARLMAIVDAFDALITHRVYRPALPAAQVHERMAAERGRRFDPDLLEVFLGRFERFCAIAAGAGVAHADTGEAVPEPA